MIPEFKVVLAKKYEDYFKKIDFKKDDWYGSRKLDGVRVITRIENGEVTFYSRAGNEFTTLNNVRKEIERVGIQNGVFDGVRVLSSQRRPSRPAQRPSQHRKTGGQARLLLHGHARPRGTAQKRGIPVSLQPDRRPA